MEASLLVGGTLSLPLDQVGEKDDRVERGAQLVRNRREKVGLQAVELRESVVGLGARLTPTCSRMARPIRISERARARSPRIDRFPMNRRRDFVSPFAVDGAASGGARAGILGPGDQSHRQVVPGLFSEHDVPMARSNCLSARRSRRLPRNCAPRRPDAPPHRGALEQAATSSDRQDEDRPPERCARRGPRGAPRRTSGSSHGVSGRGSLCSKSPRRSFRDEPVAARGERRSRSLHRVSGHGDDRDVGDFRVRLELTRRSHPKAGSERPQDEVGVSRGPGRPPYPSPAVVT